MSEKKITEYRLNTPSNIHHQNLTAFIRQVSLFLPETFIHVLSAASHILTNRMLRVEMTKSKKLSGMQAICSCLLVKEMNSKL